MLVISLEHHFTIFLLGNDI